ncbi:hypothetical protein EDC01DRAFT_594439, partial [Geopyxis carbonaria]
ELARGMITWNANRKEYFVMKAYIVLVGADMIGRSKVMRTLGNRAYQYCEYCYARGVWNRGIYCPFDIPADCPEGMVPRSRKVSRIPEEMDMRTHNSWLKQAEHIANTLCAGCAAKKGIRGKSVLLSLPSLDFPRSFPPDIMHLFFENIVPAMFRHYQGRLAKFVSTNDPWNISPDNWKRIGEAFEKSRGTFPGSFGDGLRNFYLTCHDLKAAEWKTIALQLSPVFLKTLFPAEDYDGYIMLIDPLDLLIAPYLENEDFETIRKQLISFSQYYE